MNQTMKAWLHGLLGAALTGAATTAGAVLSAMAFSPKMVWSIEFWATVGGAGIAGGVTGALLYLRQSPLPRGATTETTITVKTQEADPAAVTVESKP